MKKDSVIKNIYKLTPMQQGMLYYYIKDKTSEMYVEQIEISIEGDMDEVVMKDSLDKIVDRHDILRTVFKYQDVKQPIQVVLKERSPFFYYKDLTEDKIGERDQFIEKYKKEDRKVGFDLSKDILIRLSVFKIKDSYRMIFTFHHIILDGWSIGIVLSEFFDIYSLTITKTPSMLGAVNPYSNYMRWLEMQNEQVATKYWSDYLKDYSIKASVPKLGNAIDGEYERKEFNFTLDQEITTKLMSMSNKLQVTIGNICQALWGILLQKYNNTEDVICGTVVSGRPSEVAGIEKIVGLFINTIPLRITSTQGMTFSKLLKEIKDRLTLSEKYSYLTLADIQSYSKLKNNLFDNIMVFENYPISEKSESLQSCGCKITNIDGFEQPNYDFNIIFATGDVTKIRILYNALIYDDNIIRSIEEHIKNLANAIVCNPNVFIEELEILSESEKQKQLIDFNQTSTEYPKDQTIQEVFEKQVEKTPGNIAVVYGESKLTYTQLNEKVNSLSWLLKDKGIGKESIVGIMAERSLEMIIATFAVLKAGGCYLPIDPTFPKERIKHMIQDSGTKILLRYGEKTEFVMESDWEMEEVIDLADQELYKEKQSNPECISHANSLAYIIYTSGSTGKPKGVMIEQKSVIRVVKETNYIDIHTEDRILQLSNYAFDGSKFDIYGALLNGATLVMIEDETAKDAYKLSNVIRYQNITVFFVTTALFNVLIDRDVDCLKNVRKILFGGERVSVGYVRKAIEHLGKGKIIHVYGPTESTVYATYYFIDEVKKSAMTIPIGKSLANTKIYVVGEKNKLVPIGVPGELCIAGDGLARGYLNAEELTKEKFIDNPFDLGQKMYRTGDLVRWLPDGDIEFIGRMDGQVKLRGFRIELGEVEGQLLKHESIREAVVVDREDETGNKYLCGYIVSDKEIDTKELRKHIIEELPEYMVPQYFVHMDKLPLNSSGKVNKTILPEPDKDMNASALYVAPSNELEVKLATIWKEVLGVDKVGIQDDFFELGGHSLKATILMSKIHKELSVEVPLEIIFNDPTISELSQYISKAAKKEYTVIESAGIRESYPLSASQKSMYVLTQVDTQGIQYNIPVGMDIEGKLDVNKLTLVFKELVKRHESFRTTFDMMNGEPVQIIHNDVDFEMEYEEECEDEKLKKIVKTFIRPFNLGKAPLLRVKLIKMNQERYYLLMDMHHIISDGMSMDILFREIARLYKGEKFRRPKIQYKDYAVWQNEHLKSGEVKEQEKYWLEILGGELPVLDIVTDYQRPVIQSFEGNRIRFVADKNITDGLRKLASLTGTTMYMILLAAYNILLSKYSGQEDIIVGSPIAGRPYADVQNVIGMFVNTLAMRNQPTRDLTFKEFLYKVKENALKAYGNQEYQFEELVEKLDVNRNLNRNPIFDTMFSMQNMDISEIAIEGMRFIPSELEYKIAKFDLMMNAVEDKEEICFGFEYCTELYKKDTIIRMARQYLNILRQIVSDNNIVLSAMDLISEEEKRHILVDFNNTTKEYPKDKTIKELFEDQVSKTPDNIAVVYEDSKLTYKELNERANRLAWTLINKGIKPDTIIGIMTEPSLEMLVSVLGVLKAGGAYVPIDPSYPVDRIRYMLDDCRADIVLTNVSDRKELYDNKEYIDLLEKSTYSEKSNNPLKICNAQNLAYVIYTSGSTGLPKGVLIEHRSLINLCYWHINTYGVTCEDRATKYAGFGFDASAWEIYPYIISGALLYVIRNDIKLDTEQLSKYYQKNGITISFLPTQLCEQFIKYEIPSLRILLTGGDKLKQWRKTNYQLINNYGPTENTVVTTYFNVEKEYTNIPIGKPVDNTRIYILDQQKKLSPIGVPGELCISGDSLARGYLNNNELVKEKFIINPYEPNKRMYRTGDLVRWLSDGNIEFIGRIDTQVKIRGFRIELGEIESHLLKHKLVKEAVVIARDDEQGDKYLCGYIVSDKEIEMQKLKAYLGEKLPDYMVPQFFVQLDKLPINQSGKVDKKALPEPDKDINMDNQFVAPRNEVEEKLALIWGEVLGVEKVGIYDDFFEIGGHSLKATILASKVHMQFDVEMPLKKVFMNSTISEMAEYIQSVDKDKYISIKPVGKKEYYMTSASQKRIYILSKMDTEGIQYNMPMAMDIEGKLDFYKLNKVFEELIQRHDSFRTSFDIIDGIPVQRIADEVDFEIETVQVSNEEEIKKISNTFIRPFDLSKAPLIRVKLIKKDTNHYYLLMDMHHIISDGMSMDILFKEIAGIYKGDQLNKNKIQYKDFAEWQNEHLKSKAIKEQEMYWLDALSGDTPVLNIVTDYKRPVIQSFAGDRISFLASQEVSKGLKKLVEETGATMYMLLLAAYNVLLSKYSRQEDIIVGTPIAGRPYADVENVVGMFVNTLAMRNQPTKELTFKEFLIKVKENALKAYDNQEYQFEELVEKIGVARDLSRNPIFDTMFAMQNIDIREIEIEGLKFKLRDLEYKIAKFDFMMNAGEDGEKLLFSMEYCTELYKKDTVERMGMHFINILSQVVEDHNKLLGDIQLITEEEKEKILVDFNNTITKYPSETTIEQLFEKQVLLTPDNIAVIYKDNTLTYRQLNEKANSLAWILKKKSVTAETTVAIMAERSLEMIIATLAVLKAGGCYLPIDPTFPKERIAHMLSDSGTKLLLRKGEMTQFVEQSKLDIDEIVDLADQDLYNGDFNNLNTEGTPHDLAYIIYTSGSTGKPKGVMIEHRSVIRVVKDTNYINIIPEDRILQLSNFAFDGSKFDIYGALLNGATLVMLESSIAKDITKLANAIKKKKITIFFVTTALFNVLVDMDVTCLGDVKKVLFGGERVSVSHVRKALAHLGKDRLIHMYGPTESTVYASYYFINEVGTDDKTIPIGKPLANTSIYILSEDQKLLPIGLPGELCISGDGLARGYLNAKELTQEKFINNPYELSMRLYKTGDLARWLPDGNIEFIGRMDGQVKIRGFRIELGEIESRLLKHDLVKEAVVVDREDKNGNKYLCGYIVPKKDISVQELRKYLLEELPDYMIPQYFVSLEKFPLNSNGKVNTKVLPEPTIEASSSAQYVAPSNEMEEKLVSIWQDVLGIDKVGVQDDFFEIGGHSLKAMTMVSKVLECFDVSIELKEVFENKTIANLTELIEEKIENLNEIGQILNDIKNMSADEVNVLLSSKLK